MDNFSFYWLCTGSFVMIALFVIVCCLLLYWLIAPKEVRSFFTPPFDLSVKGSGSGNPYAANGSLSASSFSSGRKLSDAKYQSKHKVRTGCRNK